jgi:hypothetical protein
MFSRFKRTSAKIHDTAENANLAGGREISLVDRVTYMRDNFMARRGSQLVMMACTLAVLIFLGGYIYRWAEHPVDGNKCAEDYFECLWTAWTYLADPGTHSVEESMGARAIAGFISLTGIFFFATVLGFVTNNVAVKLDALKTGKSVVVERGHILVLGWTDRCPALLREIALACESEGGGTVVVLAEEEKQVLETELDGHLSKADLRGLDVVFRHGSPMVLKDLETVSAGQARAIIVLASMHGAADKADAMVLRTVLQLKSLRSGLVGHVVAEMRDVDNESLVQMVGGGNVETVVSHDIVGRLMLMAARQPGLASVYDSILGFEGDEFYIKEWPSLTGVSFGSMQARFPEAIPLGFKKAATNKVIMNPDDDHLCEPGDEILVLARDDNTYCVKAPMKVIDEGSIPAANAERREPEDILMIGWRRDVDDIIREMDTSTLLPKGSTLHMLNEVPPDERERKLAEGGLLVDDLKNITLIHHVGNSSVRRHIDPLPLANFDSILVLSDEQRETDMMDSDSHTLATLLLVRDIQHQQSNPQLHARAGRKSSTNLHLASKTFWSLPAEHRAAYLGSAGLDLDDVLPKDSSIVEHCLVVCEVLDHRTRNTITASPALKNASDFVQSNEFVSRVLAMVAERREVKCVLDDLLGSTGSRFCVRPSDEYVGAGDTLSFFALAARVRTRREILCGYKEPGHLPVINPSKKRDTREWQDVELIVIADEEDFVPMDHVSSNEDQSAAAADKQTQDSSDLGQVAVSGQASAQVPGQVPDEVPVQGPKWGATVQAVRDAARGMSSAEKADFSQAIKGLKSKLLATGP